MRWRRRDRTHLVQRYLEAARSELPGGLRAGEAAADHMDGFQGHPGKLGVVRGVGNGPIKTKTPAD